jgi:hypothetical protein
MPTELSKAHKELDKIVLAAFGLTASADDEKILERLFDLYSQAVDGLLYQGQKVKKK